MPGDLVQNANGELYYIPEEMTELLRLSDKDIEATASDVEGFGLRRLEVGGLLPEPMPMPQLDLGALQQQWSRFGPTVPNTACSGGTDDTGAMGCPG